MEQNQSPIEYQTKARLRKTAKRNNLIIFGFAILMSILLTLFYFQLRQLPNKVDVLVASKQINTGDKITLNSLRWISVLATQVKPEMITDKTLGEQVIGTKSKAIIYPGQPILLQEVKLIPGGITARLLDEGTYAVTVDLPANQAISHLINAGDKINILLLWRNQQQSYAEFVLQQIKVMAVAPNYQSNNAEGTNEKNNNNIPKTMVLQMTAEQLKEFMLASKIGDVSYVLSSAYSQEKDTSGILYGNKYNPTFHAVHVMKQIDTFHGIEKTIKVLP